ncbi:MAG: hypothetical protein AVDCRST_MAG25-1520, partial [uncultured Rubrobacteraceae bacterium]
ESSRRRLLAGRADGWALAAHDRGVEAGSGREGRDLGRAPVAVAVPARGPRRARRPDLRPAFLLLGGRDQTGRAGRLARDGDTPGAPHRAFSYGSGRM